jgi:hypothetical protein
MRKQVPPGMVVLAIIVAVLVVGFIVWRTGIVGGGPSLTITEEQRALSNKPAWQVPVDPKTGQSMPYKPGIEKNLEKSPDWKPGSEAYKPK